MSNGNTLKIIYGHPISDGHFKFIYKTKIGIKVDMVNILILSLGVSWTALTIDWSVFVFKYTNYHKIV